MQALEVFEDCALKEKENSHRVEAIHGSYVYSTLNSLDGVLLEANDSWLEKAKRLHKQETVEKITQVPLYKEIKRISTRRFKLAQIPRAKGFLWYIS